MKAFSFWLWKHRKLTFMVTAIFLVVFIFIGYLFDWTGFGGGTQITISRVVSGPSSGTVTQIKVHQQGKTLWDWLQLLIVPAVLALGGFVINLTISRSEQEAARQRDKTEREIAKDNQQEEALQTYIDKLSELLLEKNLRTSDTKDEVRDIARARTLTALHRLDKKRKKSLLQFLRESNLIEVNNAVVVLVEADLNFADLSSINLASASLIGVNFTEANLSSAFLVGANFYSARLIKADLSKAQLNEASLSFAYLSSANLSGANLNKAKLDGVDLSEANLSEANVVLANLTKANLSRAILALANLTKALQLHFLN